MKIFNFILCLLSLAFVKQLVEAGSVSYSEELSDFPPSSDAPVMLEIQNLQKTVDKTLLDAIAAIDNVRVNQTAVINEGIKTLQTYLADASPDEVDIIKTAIRDLEALRLPEP